MPMPAAFCAAFLKICILLLIIAAFILLPLGIHWLSQPCTALNLLGMGAVIIGIASAITLLRILSQYLLHRKSK